ncbi:nuclear transport factor 2 family protein [Phreatobacter cathodiphilus]|uniref:Polyketide cyclase n=1 Tax=Phreatobacter cathodiphilus TaxID=1868589 RepID=A0A2S0N7N2_9HYPH|nr:nuclear transport factor 2 family protein [Phreatobacter cathodiphilus]AVO44169.1 polyketide cyclase [Phreatobacter cathodiphilus]
MTIQLPPIIATYFDADRSGSAERVAHCFTATAVVTDEGRTHAGRDAIRQWKDEASRAYTYTASPRSIASAGDLVVVTSHVAGDFPGSPVDLNYVFRLEGDAIAALEIKP